MAEPPTRKLSLERGFIAALALIISAIFVWMVRDYLAALFLAGVVAFFLRDTENWLSAKLGGRRQLSAAILVSATILAFVVPAVIVLGMVVEQAADVTERVSPWVERQVDLIRENGLDGLPVWLPFREQIIEYQTAITAQLGDMTGTVGGLLVDGLQRGTGGALKAVLNIFILVYALFFFLLIGPSTVERSVDLLPMSVEQRRLLSERVQSTIKATVKGTFVIAVIQGVLTGVGLAVAGVPGAIFWGAVAALLSIIPMIGTPIVWLPAAIWLYVSGDVAQAIGLGLWGAIVVGTSDNLLRPVLVGKDAKMSDLMVLISTLGGLSLFGAVGIIIGPVIAALFSSIWFIFGEAFAGILDVDRDEA
ncbi:AI-2E family transporter [Maricaulis sp. CAU 1757]